MKSINLMSLENVEHLVQPEDFQQMDIHSPALNIFTDFKQHLPLVIDANTSAIQAAYLMQKSHVRLLLVIDSHEELLGTISQQELDSQHLLIMQRQGIDRTDQTVRDLMIPRSQQQVMRYQDLVTASIEDVLETLQKTGKMHCLVVDQHMHQIRGLIAASDIARRLHMPVSIEVATTFADIFRAVNGYQRPHSNGAQLKVASF
jgi:CBS-domain-containing membrane protein